MPRQIKIRNHKGQIIIWPKEAVNPNEIESIIENKSILPNDVIQQMITHFVNPLNAAKILAEYEAFAQRLRLNKKDITILLNHGQLALPYSIHATKLFAHDYLVNNLFENVYRQWRIAHDLPDWPAKNNQEMKKEVANNFYTCLSNNRYCCYNFETQLEDN